MQTSLALPSKALEYARRHALHALLVMRGGGLVDELYDGGHDASMPHALYSGTKSFWGAVAVVAQREGILRIDERVGETFPDWRSGWKGQVTLRHLLQLTSGIGFGGLGSAVPTYAKALAVELKDEPGTKFTYGGIPLQVFGAVLARKLESRSQTPHAYLQQKILEPIGMHVAKWRTLSDKTQPLPTGAFVAASEWIKYGRFVCEHRDEFAECLTGSSANARYGLGWWLGAAGAPADLFYASGAAGQALYIVPSLHTVIVHFGNASSFKHEAFLKRVFA